MDGRGEATYSRIEARADAHHAAAAAANDVAALRAETAAYGTDMAGLMDDMMSSCSDMMGSGMMGASDMDRMGDMTARMGKAVVDHRARMEGMTDVAAMRAECEDHHAVMAGMLEELRGMLMDGGMM